MHHDKAYWKDPEVFRPERFIDDKGMLIHHDNLIPFGLGKNEDILFFYGKNVEIRLLH